MFVLDTSFWIEYFKNNLVIINEIEHLLNNRKVVALSYVFAELYQGSKSEKEIKIINSYWQYLPKIDETEIWIEAGIFSYKNKLKDRGIGILDSAIIVGANRCHGKLLTLDKKINKFLSV